MGIAHLSVNDQQRPPAKARRREPYVHSAGLQSAILGPQFKVLAKVVRRVIAIDALENIEESFEQLSIFVRGNLGFSFLRLFQWVCLYPVPLNVFKLNRFIKSVVKLR